MKRKVESFFVSGHYFFGKQACLYVTDQYSSMRLDRFELIDFKPDEFNNCVFYI